MAGDVTKDVGGGGECPHTQANVSVHETTNRKTLIDNGVHGRTTKGSATDVKHG